MPSRLNTAVLSLLAIASGAFAWPPPPQDPAGTARAGAHVPREQRLDDFDFWLGEWTVANSRLDRDSGQWRETGTSRARIRRVAGGRAILEEWDGKDGPIEGTFGMSLRFYDPAKDRWVIILNWPGGPSPNPSFSFLEGGFFGEGEDARGEFFPPPLFDGPGPEPARRDSVRFTFSKPRADSCQWDMANPGPRGTWQTTWIMKFARTASPDEASASVEVAAVPDECPCEADGARDLDQYHGRWAGDGRRLIDGEWTDTSADLLSTPVVRGCLTFHELAESLADGSTLKHFESWAFDRDDETWEGFQISSESAIPAAFVSTSESGARTDPWGRAAQGDGAFRTAYRLAGPDTLVVTIERRVDGVWAVVAEYELACTDG